MDSWYASIAKVMTRKRFLDLLYNIHVNDNSKMPAAGSDQFDKLYKIRPFLEDLKLTSNCNTTLTVNRQLMRQWSSTKGGHH